MKLKMKKIITLTVILSLILSLVSLFASCDGGEQRNDGEFKIVCSIFPQYDFCRVITGSDENITLLQKNGTDMHSYEPTSADILKIANCDLLVYTGGSSDGWVEGVLRSAGGDVATFDLFSHSKLLCEESADGHSHAHGEDGDCEIYDEHVWLSIDNSISIVRALCDTLCKANPDSAELYRKNTESYISELSALDLEFEAICRDKSIIVADRFPFLYFCHEYGMDYHAAFPGCSTETEASFDTVLALINTAKQKGIDTVFKIDNSAGETADVVAEQIGAKVKNLNSCQSVTDAQFSSGVSFLSIMRENLNTLKEVLS